MPEWLSDFPLAQSPEQRQSTRQNYIQMLLAEYIVWVSYLHQY